MLLGNPPWWWLIHAMFMPLAWLCGQWPVAPYWYLLAFVTLFLVFWRTDLSRVPLYLSNRQTSAAVTTRLPGTPCQVLDAGCGHGGLLRELAEARPDCRFVGIEHAPP